MTSPLPDKGLDPAEILADLESLGTRDVAWRDGRSWSLVYHAGDDHKELLDAAYRLYASTNGLSPSAFPSLATMEADIVAVALDLLRADRSTAGGTMASGGTESIMLALKAYRDRRVAGGEGTRPHLVVPVTAHPAFHKGAQLLGYDVTVTGIGEDLRADLAQIEAALRPETTVVGASAPCYPYGVIDPIADIGELAADRGTGLHIDACLGGFALPFIRRLGRDVAPFDFEVDGVTSISADLHKYGYAAKGASTVLYRDRDLRRHQYFTHIGWPGGSFGSPTLLGSRNGGVIAAAWAGLRHLGRDGYESIFASIMDVTDRLREGITALDGFSILGDPAMSVMAFGSRHHDVFAVADTLEESGWRIDRQRDPDCLHLIVNPTHTVDVADAFLADLRAAAAAAPPPGKNRGAAAYGVVAELGDDDTDVAAAITDALDRVYDGRLK
ncbi:MAG: aspartate aminotransferase family protein [Acidimicrobiales bacterium]